MTMTSQQENTTTGSTSNNDDATCSNVQNTTTNTTNTNTATTTDGISQHQFRLDTNYIVLAETDHLRRQEQLQHRLKIVFQSLAALTLVMLLLNYGSIIIPNFPPPSIRKAIMAILGILWALTLLGASIMYFLLRYDPSAGEELGIHH